RIASSKLKSNKNIFHLKKIHFTILFRNLIKRKMTNTRRLTINHALHRAKTL
ncbi:unnamed protein product, partial [Hymenolepis diminuta]